MDVRQFKRVSEFEWHIPPTGAMRVPGVLYADEPLVQDMDQKVFEQMVNVATLPGIVKASFAMPDAHWGYGFPIGGVAAFDPHEGGVVSAGGVGFDISCGVRNLRTGLAADQILDAREPLANELYRRVPAGVGSTGTIRLNAKEMDAMLLGGAKWAVDRGWGLPEDLDRIEEGGRMEGALPQEVSEHAKKRQRDEMGTLGSGNHYLEVQKVEQVFDEPIADRLGVHVGDAIVSIHCGSRGLGHQIGTDFLRRMTLEAPKHGLRLPDRELASAPLASDLGEAYLGAMRAGINCALANREIITHWVRQAFEAVFPGTSIPLLYDVSHNTCKLEEHQVNGARKKLYVHRKGATRAWGPGHPGLPSLFRETGQPVLIGGTMGTNSYILVGSRESMGHAFGSSCHGAGRAMSRHQALKLYRGRDVVDRLAREGVLVKSPSWRGVAEEAPGAYKDVSAVVEESGEASPDDLHQGLISPRDRAEGCEEGGMPELIRPVDYYHVTVHDRPGEGYWIYTQLRQAGVRLVGSAGFPLPNGKAQLSLIPENPKAFLAAAEDCECELSGRKQAFLIQGEERLGALADIYGRLERVGISVVAAHAVSAGDGHWGMMLWVKPPDYEKAGKALGV